MDRRGRRLAGVVGAAVLAALLVPRGLLWQGDRERDRAAAQADLLQRVAGWSRAAEWYAMAGASPLHQEQAARARADLDARVGQAFEEQRRTLSAGEAGARAHLSWLEQQAQAPAWVGEQAALARIRALVSYGQLDQAVAAAAGSPGDFAAAWSGLASLWAGRLDAVSPEQARQAPGLELRRQGPPGAEEETPETDLSRLVAGERARRRGEPLEARRLLAPLVEGEGELAAAAAWSWGQSLVDEQAAQAPGLMLVGVDAGVEPLALAGLRARLLLAPPEDPSWTAAWLVLAELESRRGQQDAALQAAWAAIAASTPTWAPDPALLPALARLDAAASMHPDRVQRARLAVGEARIAAAARGEDPAELVAAEAALFVLEARGHLAAADLDVARLRLARAAELVPDSPAIVAWQVLVELQADQPDAARARLAALPALPDTADDDRLRQVAAPWLDPPEVAAVDAPARALRTRLRQPWDPGEPLAFARAHADQPAELLLALSSPPEDRADLAQALAQAHLHLRIARALDQPQALAEATARRDALSRAALAEPLWALFALGAFRLEGPDLPPPVRIEGAPGADGP